MAGPLASDPQTNPYRAPLEAPGQSPTNVRFAVLTTTTLTSFLLYLDRICVSEIAKVPGFQSDIGLDKHQTGIILGAFFFAYALAQVPSGWLSDRFGARGMMAFYVALWSVFTALTGLATGFISLLIARLGCGLAQAGAYPTSGGLLSRWIPFESRGKANSTVALGGRIGLAFAPLMTDRAMLLLGGSWRGTLLLYGIAGLGAAALFWHVFRDRPELHPRVNAAECQLIESGRPAGMPSPYGRAGRAPLGAIVRSRSLWCMSAAMFCTNIGWAFLATWLPTYLVEVKHVAPSTGAWMTTLALLGGMLGMFCGGFVTDISLRLLPLRWARSLPMSASRFLGMAAYIAALNFDSIWAATAAFALVGFATDLGTAATWSFAQDVAGRHVGSVLGWANMWGNLGATLVAVVLPTLIQGDDGSPNWDKAFMFCALGFLVSGLACLGVDASRPIVVEPRPATASA